MNHLLETKCMGRKCGSKGLFVCPMCQEFIYCSKNCRKRHNFRKCPRQDAFPTGNMTAHWKAICDATKAMSAKDTEQKVFSMLMRQQKRRPKSVAASALMMYPFAKHDATPDQLRGLTTVFFKCFPRQWDEEMWKMSAHVYLEAVGSFATPADLEFAVEFTTKALASYKHKDPRDDFYQIAKLAQTQTQIIQTYNGSVNYDVDVFKNVDHPWLCAQIDFLFSTKPWYEALIAFLEACSTISLEEDMHNDYKVAACIHASNICYLFGQQTEATMFADAAMGTHVDNPYPVAILSAYVRSCPLENVKELISVYMKHRADATCIHHANVLKRFAEALDDKEQSLLYLADAYAVCKRNQNFVYALDVLYDMMHVYIQRDDTVNVIDLGRIMLDDFQKIDYDSFTGFYNFYVYAFVLETLTHQAYEDRRFDDAWTFAALYYVGHKSWEGWQNEALEPVREYVYEQDVLQIGYMTRNWSQEIKGFARRRGVVQPDQTDAYRKRFGNCETAHQVFCETVCLEDDTHEKSYAFVWFETETFVYAFVVDTTGVLSVRRKSKEEGTAAALLPSMARSLERTPDRDTSLVLVNPPEPRLSTCKALEGVCVWNA